jgi:hypothetical protein
MSKGLPSQRQPPSLENRSPGDVPVPKQARWKTYGSTHRRWSGRDRTVEPSTNNRGFSLMRPPLPCGPLFPLPLIASLAATFSI